MNIIMQLINADDGTRSEPVSGDRTELARMLREQDTIPSNTLVLVLMEHCGEEWDFSNAPLFKKDTFCDVLLEKTNG